MSYVQQYLITGEDIEPFTTELFEYENHYQDGMVVYDLHSQGYTTDGKNWKQYETDHL